MAATPIMSMIATTTDKLSQLPIKNGQLIFVRDKQTIALDYSDKRTFYHEIISLDTEADRLALESPVKGTFYFVIDTAILYRYETEWIKVTNGPQSILCIGVEFPELGSSASLYVNTVDKEISIWDAENRKYVVVADSTKEVTNEDIDSLFS
jgi:hypothetical protein